MINITVVDFNDERFPKGKMNTFNWTIFNENIIQIYGYIDDILFQEDDQYDLLRLEYLKSNFKTAWTTNLTSRDAWEIRYAFNF